MSKKFYTDMEKAATVIEKANASGNFKGIYVTLQVLKAGSTSDKHRASARG